MAQVAIIGAGVAGLAAANYLVDNGVAPFIIDADVPGKPKVCGEFFSHEVLPQLQAWNIPLLYKHKAILQTPYAQYTFDFEKPIASVSRPVIESLLAQRAKSLGAQLLTSTSVQSMIKPGNETDQYNLELIGKSQDDESIRTIKVDRLLIAAGRFFNGAPQNAYVKKEPRYIGIKGYFKGSMPLDELQMFINDNGYAGMMHTDSDTISFCCLADAQAVKHAGGPENFVKQFIKNFDFLEDMYERSELLFDGWITVPVFAFGKKIVPDWPQSYFIGDAAAGIYPASGNGLAMGITSGIMAAHYALQGKDHEYKQAWHQRYSKRLKVAELLHYMFMHPTLCSFGFSLASFAPALPRLLYNYTRED